MSRRCFDVCKTCARLASSQVFITIFSPEPTCDACGGPRGKNGEVASPEQFAQIQALRKEAYQTRIAPNACIVCEKPAPADAASSGWTYLANAKPVGALACSPECTAVAIDRHNKTGHVDVPKERNENG